MSELVVGLTGVVVGFLLNEGATFWRKQREEVKQAKAVRTILHIEIIQNLNALQNFWDEANKVEGTDNFSSDESRAHYMVGRLRRLVFPSWSYKVWESQLPLLPNALNVNEIKQVNHFYNQLNDITVLYSKMLQRQSSGVRMLQNTEALLQYASDVEFSSGFWEDFQRFVLDLLQKGCPFSP